MSHKMHVNVWVKVYLTKEILSLCPIDREGKWADECTPQDDFESQVKYLYEEMDFSFSDTTENATVEDSLSLNIDNMKLKEKTAEFEFELTINMDEGEDLSIVLNEMSYELKFQEKVLETEIVDYELIDSK